MMLYSWKNRAIYFSIYLVLILMLTKVNCQFEDDDDEDDDENSRRNMETKSNFNTTTEDSSVYNTNLTTNSIIYSSITPNQTTTSSIFPRPQSTVTSNLADSDDLLSVTSATLPLPNNPIKITPVATESTTSSAFSSLTMESAITSATSATTSEGTTNAASSDDLLLVTSVTLPLPGSPIKISSATTESTTSTTFTTTTDSTIASATSAAITEETIVTSAAVPSTDNPVNDQVAIFDVLPISTLNKTPIIDTTLSPDSVSITKIYEGEGLIILCSSEILTINEDFSMPQILPTLKKEYTISFEISGDQGNVELGIEVTNSDLVTKEFKIFDNNSKLNKMFTFIKVFENNTVATWTNRTMRCGSGPKFTQQTWEYINSNRKKIEIKVSSPDHALNIVESINDTNTLQPATTSTQTMSPSVNQFTDYSTTNSYTTKFNTDIGISDTIIPKCPEDLPYEKFYDPNEEQDFENYDYNELQNEIDEKFKNTPYENCPITEIKWIMSTPKEGLTSEITLLSSTTEGSSTITKESVSTTIALSTERININDSATTETTSYYLTTRRQSIDSLSETNASSTENIPDFHQLHLNISVELDHIATGYYKNGSEKSEIDIISRDYKDFILNETTGLFESDSNDNKIKIGFVKDTDNFIKIAFDIPPEILSEIKEKVIDNPQHSLFGKDFFGNTYPPEVQVASTTYSEEAIVTQLPSTTMYDLDEIYTEEPEPVPEPEPEPNVRPQLPFETIKNQIYFPKYDTSVDNFNYYLKNKNPKLLRLVQEVPTMYKETIRNNKYEIPIMIASTPPPPSPPVNNFQVMFPSKTLNSMPYQQPNALPWEIDPNYRNQQMQNSNLPILKPPLNFAKRDLYNMPNPYNDKVNNYRSFN